MWRRRPSTVDYERESSDATAPAIDDELADGDKQTTKTQAVTSGEKLPVV